jgi:pyruvate/2-oxoglutarate dehydrogenase complex dihydrolipoamide dehydrogenase (E3) component
MHKYEAIILGGGKGGKTLAMDMAKNGHKVAMIEDDKIGGSCINVACIPTKILVKSAKVAKYAENSEMYGIGPTQYEVNFKNVQEHKNKIVSGMRSANLDQFNSSGMDLYIGKGYFIENNVIEVKLNTPKNGEELVKLTADKIFINTGAFPFVPPLKGLDKINYHTNETLLNVDYVPDHLIILGGGYIGLEFAQIFNRFGSKVTVLEASKDFISREDQDVSLEVHKILTDEGINILTDVQVQEVLPDSNQIKLNAIHNGKPISMLGSDFLISIGRSPNTSNLNLSNTGIEVDQRGFIKVNEYLETTEKNVWAIGDVKGGAQFTHVSWDDYRIIKHNLANPNSRKSITSRQVPYTVFLDPELARIGITESEAVAKGLNFKIAKIPSAIIPRAKTSVENKGFLKAIIDSDTNLILGVSIICAEAGEILGVIQVAMEADIPFNVLRDTMFAHPTMVEAINIWFSSIS